MSQRSRLAKEQERARRARLRVALAVGVAAVVLGAIALVASSQGSDGDAGAGDARRVSMTDFAFSPDPIVLPAGDGARLEVVNDGSVAHDLLVRELGKGTPDLPPGGSMELDLSEQPPGTYEVVCDIVGHVEAGMVTQLTLE